MDRITKEHRSWNMSRIKGQDTAPEKKVRSYLHKQGFRFRINKKDLPGKPDIVLSKYKSAVFVHGCYWHRHKNCKFAYTPKTNIEFWLNKFARTVERDKKKSRALQNLGWKVLVIWECQVDKPHHLEKLKQKILQQEMTCEK